MRGGVERRGHLPADEETPEADIWGRGELARDQAGRLPEDVGMSCELKRVESLEVAIYPCFFLFFITSFDSDGALMLGWVLYRIFPPSLQGRIFCVNNFSISPPFLFGLDFLTKDLPGSEGREFEGGWAINPPTSAMQKVEKEVFHDEKKKTGVGTKEFEKGSALFLQAKKRKEKENRKIPLGRKKRGMAYVWPGI